ncbi:MAG: Riboflavin biosynthesis protein RibF [Alphaproteobacteria bacterium MarineAlpha9_Bin4]|nr:hypothetical protein [Pelagibacterales bacterium]PPR25628.1 MAG: Riboflavin biosynthesis protein RibF [Alphaproteobacteria bacterium MarineAlpha9_Bin4]|tara:strand:- start:1699 stop:2667 length:969 start_codon:yes stop_codon:yes gene_type:complete
MIIKRNYIENKDRSPLSIAIGNFDGIHLGHRFILNELKKFKKSDKDKIAVLTFNPHPVKVLKPDIWKNNLIRFRTKFRLLKSMGIDVLYQIPFTITFSNFSSHFFIENILIKNIRMKNILVGEDFRFGKNREGDINLLKEYAEKKVFNLKYFKKKGSKDFKFSSSIVRQLVSSGHLKKASKILGYYWEVEGKVISGKSKGRELGYPTANLNYLYQIPPANGIYAGWAKIEGESIWRKAAISSGIRPHYNGVKKILEVHLLYFSGNLYQKRLRVAFIEKIRDELKFDSEKSLINQMDKDCKNVKNILEKKYINNDNEGHNERY